MKLAKLIKPHRITDGRDFRLKDHDPADTCGLDFEKEEALGLLKAGIARLADLQDKLYAENDWSVLLIFQAMDAAGKDSVIKHVMSGINPQGCQIYSFKAPSPEEIDHDYMWRTTCRLPERGRIGIFNRSYYEEVLVVRVHPELLEREKIPKALVTKRIWTDRMRDIAHFEDYLARNGTLILKFFLNVSKEEQRRRFLERIDDPNKNWKFSMSDVTERRYWGDCMHACEDMILRTSAPHAPWFVVPADNKWFTRVVVAAAIIDGMENLKLSYPTLDEAARRELLRARAALLKEAE